MGAIGFALDGRGGLASDTNAGAAETLGRRRGSTSGRLLMGSTISTSFMLAAAPESRLVCLF